jgi:dihydrofolate reductase
MGRRMFDFGEEPWGNNPPFHVPVFVLTHDSPEKLVKEGGTTFTFVADGIESTLEQAKAVAGDRDVSLVGGANVIQHSTWAPGYSTTCKFTSCPHCSATVGDCSSIPAPSKSNWRVRG